MTDATQGSLLFAMFVAFVIAVCVYAGKHQS
jgi:hypothetical protein